MHLAEVLCHQLQIGSAAYESGEGCDETALKILDLDRAALAATSSNGFVKLFMESVSRAPRFESLVKDVRKNLVEVMEELTKEERLVIALTYYEGLSPSEVATVLNTSPDDVERHRESALARLRAAISLLV